MRKIQQYERNMAINSINTLENRDNIVSTFEGKKTVQNK